MKYGLRITEKMAQEFLGHLYSGDGKEAVAFALCGVYGSGETRGLVAHRVILIPYDQCDRSPDRVSWPKSFLLPLVNEARQKGWGLVKFHSHPGGFSRFSYTDDESDLDLFEFLYDIVGSDVPHYSVIVLPDGKMIGRTMGENGGFEPLSRIAVVGENVIHHDYGDQILPESRDIRLDQVFGDGTVDTLQGLKIGVVGASGTGSHIIECCYRLQVGHLVVVEPDWMEHRNLDRIVNSRTVDAENEAPKVEVVARAIRESGSDTKLTVYRSFLDDDPQIIQDLSTCDFLVGCVDSTDGRYIMNLISTFYLVPFIDTGTGIIPDGQGGIKSAVANVHYLQPGLSSLISRGSITGQGLERDLMSRRDPEEYERRRQEGYIEGMVPNRLAVISLNGLASYNAFNELLSRIHGFDPVEPCALFSQDVKSGEISQLPESVFDPDEGMRRSLGKGDVQPLLGMPVFNKRSHEKAG